MYVSTLAFPSFFLLSTIFQTILWQFVHKNGFAPVDPSGAPYSKPSRVCDTCMPNIKMQRETFKKVISDLESNRATQARVVQKDAGRVYVQTPGGDGRVHLWDDL